VAQKIQTTYTDDFDGSQAEGTIRFGLDGVDYEIDLNAAHAKQLRKTAAPYVAVGRKVGRTVRRPSGRSGHRRAGASPNTSDVREWAKAQGLEVKDRGRVPAELVVKFQAATGS
jgi:hypothetical protein